MPWRWPADGEEGLRLATRGDHDLMILDVMLPKKSGLDVCKELRRNGSSTPIIMLTARGQEIDKIVGLKLGADDYVTKPFSFMELLARVEAVLRRVSRTAAGDEYAFGDVTLDFRTYQATKAGMPARAHPARVPHPPLLHRPRRRSGQPRVAAQPRLGLRQLRLHPHRRHAHGPPAPEDRRRRRASRGT